MADENDMDYHAPGSTLAERMRTAQVLRKIDKQAYGFSTQNYHRNERIKDVTFVVLAVLMAVAVLVALLT